MLGFLVSTILTSDEKTCITLIWNWRKRLDVSFLVWLIGFPKLRSIASHLDHTLFYLASAFFGGPNYNNLEYIKKDKAEIMIAGDGVPNSNTHTNNVLGPIISVCRQQTNFLSSIIRICPSWVLGHPCLSTWAVLASVWFNWIQINED